jgi:hypothetical protein
VTKYLTSKVFINLLQKCFPPSLIIARGIPNLLKMFA